MQELVEAVTVGMAAGLNLDHINSSSLRRLLAIPAFQPKQEAERILNKRTHYEATKAST